MKWTERIWGLLYWFYWFKNLRSWNIFVLNLYYRQITYRSLGHVYVDYSHTIQFLICPVLKLKLPTTEQHTGSVSLLHVKRIKDAGYLREKRLYLQQTIPSTPRINFFVLHCYYITKGINQAPHCVFISFCLSFPTKNTYSPGWSTLRRNKGHSKSS